VLLYRKDLAHHGWNPTVLSGYGGFGRSVTPEFSRNRIFWLENGGVVALAGLRGGGEYGLLWHDSGRLSRKQNAIDDLVAAAKWLVQRKYTRPQKLALHGISNGGLLVGAVLTQQPDLIRAVLCDVPLTDMIRYPRFGMGRLWIPEYGDPARQGDFSWLYAYSPYHHVRYGVRYPAVFLRAAEADTRVDPCHARKMAAILQARTKSGRPVMLRVESRSGHGVGKPHTQLVDELVDQWTFLCDQLGLRVRNSGATTGPR
jgi:prolyl oligopeptidase